MAPTAAQALKLRPAFVPVHGPLLDPERPSRVRPASRRLTTARTPYGPVEPSFEYGIEAAIRAAEVVGRPVVGEQRVGQERVELQMAYDGDGEHELVGEGGGRLVAGLGQS